MNKSGSIEYALYSELLKKQRRIEFLEMKLDIFDNQINLLREEVNSLVDLYGSIRDGKNGRHG